MAGTTQLPLPQTPESCLALWQEEKQCINSAPEWVCKLTFDSCVCACTIPYLPVADQIMLLNYYTFFNQVFEVVMCEKNYQAYFYATCSSLTCPKNNTLKKFHT
jgi:hypothetical protein